ncbi:MAG: hypothetical protein EpisKO_41360 [Epibacterium sp.]
MGKEGAAVRQAYDGPEVGYDQLISEFEARVKEQRARSSDSSESSAKTKSFLDDTGLNSQAYRWAMTIFKKLDMKDGQHKAMDIVRSLDVLVPLMHKLIEGAGTGEMNLDGPPAKADGKPAAKPKADAKQRAAKPKTTPAKTKAAPSPRKKNVPATVDADTEEFNAEVDKTMGQKGNVTPIDFGGAKA